MKGFGRAASDMTAARAAASSSSRNPTQLARNVSASVAETNKRLDSPTKGRDLQANKRNKGTYDRWSWYNGRIILLQGDITRLHVDAIVNAANSSLLGGGGVDGAIHRAAGSDLVKESAKLAPCPTGEVRVTKGYRLPARFVLHTVGPTDGDAKKLSSCYSRCLDAALERDLKSVAFCCISTGVYGYPNEEAAHVALKTVKEWFESHPDAAQNMEVTFCVFLDLDLDIYQDAIPKYFPVGDESPSSSAAKAPAEEESN